MHVVHLVALALQNPVKTTGMLGGQAPVDLNDGRLYLWVAIGGGFGRAGTGLSAGAGGDRG